jgi:hypothetical protein
VHGVCECGMRTLRALHAWELDTYCDAAVAMSVHFAQNLKLKASLTTMW